MQLNWKDLEVFVHVCESGSLTHAAMRCHISVPAVSARIQRLEDRAGSPLLVRHARGVTPNALGFHVLGRARTAVREFQLLRGELEAASSRQDAKLRLLCNTSALLQHLPHLMADLVSNDAGVALEVTESSSRRAVIELREQRADIGIVSDAVDVAGLTVQSACEDPLVLVVARGHALAAKRSVAFADALSYPQVTFSSTSALATHLSEQAQALGRALAPRVSVSSLESICSLVERDTGVAVLSTAMWKSVRGRFAARAVALDDPWARRRLLVCAGPRAAGERRVRDMCASIARQLVRTASASAPVR